MIVGYHLIIGMYGFWLPNDPRGSWSDFVGSWELFRYGGATKTTARRSVAHREHDSAQRLSAKRSLKYPPVILTGVQARAVGRGFGEHLRCSGFPAWACAILPDHVHLVVGRGRYEVEKLVTGLKGRATNVLMDEGIHPQLAYRRGAGRLPKCFARGAWSVYLDPEDVDRAIRYVEDNPIKEGLPRQRWSFVTECGDGGRGGTRGTRSASRRG